MKYSRWIFCFKAMLPLIIGFIVVQQKISSAEDCPCDIYKAAGTPCAAAYSTVRALYGSYDGALYQVRRKDGQLKDIKPLTPGGIANAAAQDSFLTGTTGTISKIYDQSTNHNDLTKAPKGNQQYGPKDCIEADANALSIWINGHKAYGVHVTGDHYGQKGLQVGYRNTNTAGVPKKDNPETEYMVADGKYYNGECCFDFGNAEMSSTVYGDMETIYFGNCNWWDKGAGSGPWIMADLENGVYNKGGPGNFSNAGDKNADQTNKNDISFSYPFVTAYLKGNSANATNGGPFTLKGGNAQSGTLTTIWDGAFPTNYSPRNRQGGIVLGVGGDNSSGAQGNFFEGVIATGFASSATDDAIHANIVAARYGSTTTKVSDHINNKSQSSLFQARFNPLKANAVISYTLQDSKHVDMKVFDQQGRQIATIINGVIPAGQHETVWDAKQVPAGVYVVRMMTDGNNVWNDNIVIGR